MILDKNIAKLICEIEPCIGKQCYNPNSYNGWTGEEGCEYRYRICYRDKENPQQLQDTRYRIPERVPEYSPDVVNTMKYKFGANHLFVGVGIRKLLEELEERYGISFNELEDGYQMQKEKTE